MGQELTTLPGGAIATRETVAAIKARVQLVQQVMRGVMKNGVHYGTIPGTPKPTLFKPGAEIIALAFQFAPEYDVDDLSMMPEFVRYRITCRLCDRGTGAFIGSGQGEASSDEEKYRWRKAVCKEEFEATPEDRRRVKWMKGRENSAYSVEQVRIEPADIANTVLKMGEKRAFVDAIRTTSGCSDMFAQDLDDLPPEMRQAATEDDVPAPKPIGEKDYKKLVAQARRYGYTEEDVQASAATAGFEGKGPDMPDTLANRLYQAMKAKPKPKEEPKQEAPSEEEAVPADAPDEHTPDEEIPTEDRRGGYTTPQFGND